MLSPPESCSMKPKAPFTLMRVPVQAPPLPPRMPPPPPPPKMPPPPQPPFPQALPLALPQPFPQPLLKPLSPPLSPLFPPWASLTMRLRSPSGLPWSFRACVAISSVAKVTKQTPFELPSSFSNIFRRVTSPTSSKAARISLCCRSPTLATKSCLGSASRGPSLPLPSPFLPLPLPLPLPPPNPPNMSFSSSMPKPMPELSKESMRLPPMPKRPSKSSLPPESKSANGSSSFLVLFPPPVRPTPMSSSNGRSGLGLGASFLGAGLFPPLPPASPQKDWS
mmetsp:Transcript_41497/g.107354  ORF Transcript_41497/g.107354 Transcript_41497/m.107354 type:complete len:279 (-) Transcript_41497:33-869(-)